MANSMPNVSREFWNSQLQNSKTVPDHDQWAGRYGALSKAAVDEHGAPERLVVGPHEGQALWRTRSGRDSHRVIFIHGGYWRAYGAADFAFPVHAAAAADASFYNVDYRLMPRVPMGEVVADTLLAAQRAMEGAERAVIVGHSAGGHLAVEAALRLPRAPDAVVAISGLYDLTPLRRAFIQDEIRLSTADVAAYSPQTRAAEMPCPVHVVAGDDETVEFKRQSAMLYDALEEAGRPATLAFAPGRNHSQIVADLADPASDLCERVRACLA